MQLVDLCYLYLVVLNVVILVLLELVICLRHNTCMQSLPMHINVLTVFLSGDHNSLVRAFVLNVPPMLEYTSVVWSPCLKCEITEIEKVQRRLSKRLKGIKNISYGDRLVKIGLPSLELRHLHLDLIFCYKLVFSLVSVKFPDFFWLQSCTEDQRSWVQIV